ncbi:uncharacterized protein LOC121868311 [Homarus americanus]|uniref:uncharacterized protein LOC121868311 n=1 Tax=Homarus americanus TaxID=6706 RepID=UPI001C46CE57|nr:uncharacterized protein LOC121868311 [Homarus americanus]
MLEVRGRVVVYSVLGCPHCVAAKKTLRDLGVPLIDVSVDRFPAVRRWLQEKTGKTSVPQIFFNETYVGGNDSLQKLLKDEEEWNKLLADIQVNEAKEDALIIPHPSEATDTVSDSIKFVCESDPIASIAEELRASGIPHYHRISLFSSAKNVFSGQEFINWIMETKNISEEESTKIGSELLEKKYVKPLDSTQTSFLNDPKMYYSLIDNCESTALNGGSPQSCMLDNAAELSETLRKLILQLFSDHISLDGKVVNYKEMKDTEGFKEYVKLSRELQRVAVEKLDQDGRKAFFINIYNALVIHATVENGPPSNWLSRLKFFDKTSYIVGGHIYSLNEMENGVLRANKRGVTQLFAPFGKSDPRRMISLIQVDPRIHFALNCGAKSCPPIKTFSAENINEELRVATEAYLETDEGLQIDEARGVVQLSSLLRWYSSDFGNTTEDVLRWVHRNVTFPEKKEALERVMESNKWKVNYISYNWNSNASD